MGQLRPGGGCSRRGPPRQPHQRRAARLQPTGRLSARPADLQNRSEEHTSELQSLMRISYAVFCLKKKQTQTNIMPASNRKSTYTNIKNKRHNIITTNNNI